jgi:hypothetical protein
MRNQMYLNKEKEIENALTPFGFMSDGLENDLDEVNLNW